MPRNAIFLSGWEYNRVLQDDPLAPRQSALPAEALWNGGAQFWLFEHVYCTREALEGEIAAAETLGWATGHIFQDLQKRGFLKVFDWKDLKGESPLQHQRLVEVHKVLRSQYDEATILHLLDSGRDTELEEIKLELLMPILEHLHCIHNISPNSLRQWIASDQQGAVPPQSQALRRFAQHFTVKRTPIRAGTQLCSLPGTGVPEEDRFAQKKVEETVQKPMIPDLLSGRLSQQDYMEALLPTAEVYGPIDNQLLHDYWQNIEKLERLRNAAKRHLWNDLHGDWIPRLEQDPTFPPKFERLLRDALLRAQFDPYLEYLTIVAIAVVAGAVGGASGALAPLVGLPPTPATGVAIAATGGVLQTIHKNIRKKSNEPTLFFQKADHISQMRFLQKAMRALKKEATNRRSRDST